MRDCLDACAFVCVCTVVMYVAIPTDSITANPTRKSHNSSSKFNAIDFYVLFQFSLYVINASA